MPDDVWVRAEIEVGASTIEGFGLFATTDLVAGTALLRLAGRVVSTDELQRLIREASGEASMTYIDSLTVDEDQHLVLAPRSVAHFGNHSCDPNAWHDGTFEIVSRRAIGAGEEVTIDYATESGAPGFSMECWCGAAMCRGVVTSEDWRIRELQDRYKGHWVAPLERRIAALASFTQLPDDGTPAAREGRLESP
jgi:hypothetical protein